jgi:F-type H+-transporting ATPase subunit delta
MSSKHSRRQDADIGRHQIAAVYAKALLGATERAGVTDSVVDEFDSLVDDVLERLPQLESMLASPRISPAEKSALLARVFGDRMSDHLLTFLQVVCRHGRLDCLRHMRGAVRHLFNQLRQRVEVHVSSAQPLSDESRGQIVGALRERLASEIDLSSSVDERLIGGLVVRVGDTLYDGSIANRLAKMRSGALERMKHELREHVARFTGTVDSAG